MARVSPLADPGSMLSRTHALEDGRRVRLRLTRPSDALRVEHFLSGLSEETRQRRFFSPMPTLRAQTVRHFTFYDPRRRRVVAATLPGAGGEEIVGLGDVAFLETGLAEIGMVVDDELQGHGIGGLLGEAIAALAVSQGATHLKAELQNGNPPVLKLMERLGATVRTVENGNEVAFTKLPAMSRFAA